MYVLVHFGSYRARKYRASRTVFRGVRFWMKGKGWAYAVRAILWDLATLLTLGLALPWAMASLERYRMRHTYFGSIQGDFTGTGWSLFKRGWWVWVLGCAIAASLVAAMRFTSPTLLYLFYRFTPLVVFVAILFSAILLWPLAMTIFTRWQIDGLRFGNVTASSRLGIVTYYGIVLKLISSSICFLIGFALVAGVIAYSFSSFFAEALDALEELSWASLSAILLMLAAYLIALLGLGVLQRYFLGRGLWAAIVTSTTVTNLQALDATVAAGQPAGVLGEGLADALDFNVGI
jgi:uncharacterized membrane protein YjgN (DUF898 family)